MYSYLQLFSKFLFAIFFNYHFICIFLGFALRHFIKAHIECNQAIPKGVYLFSFFCHDYSLIYDALNFVLYFLEHQMAFADADPDDILVKA